MFIPSIFFFFKKKEINKRSEKAQKSAILIDKRDRLQLQKNLSKYSFIQRKLIPAIMKQLLKVRFFN